MTKKLRFDSKTNDNEQIISFHGEIDEDSLFSEVTFEDRPRIVLILEGVEAINSCGIREWINFLKGIPEGKSVVYQRCPQLIVEQMNMIREIGSNVKVESFFAPFFCEKCDEEKQVLIASDSYSKDRELAETCDSCSEVMEFDSVEDIYFRFMKAA